MVHDITSDGEVHCDVNDTNVSRPAVRTAGSTTMKSSSRLRIPNWQRKNTCVKPRSLIVTSATDGGINVPRSPSEPENSTASKRYHPILTSFLHSGHSLVALRRRLSATFALVAVFLYCLNVLAKQYYRQWNFPEVPGHPYRLFLSYRQLEAMMNDSQRGRVATIKGPKAAEGRNPI